MPSFDRETIYGSVRMGHTKADIEILQGQALTKEQSQWYREARLLLKHEKRQEAERKQREKLDGWLAGTSWEGATSAPLPMTDAERQRKHRAAGREIGEIPPCANPWRRNIVCRYSLLAFGLEYCMGSYEGMKPLLKRPPSPRMTAFIQAVQNVIWFGGHKHVRWPRGKGKTTWVKIAAMWAMLYGYKRFFVIVEKVKSMGREVVEEIWQRIRLSPEISADFPEFAIPMNDVAYTPQRMRMQTCGGKPTRMKQEINGGYYRFPTVAGFPNTGGIICWRGADQALRGINIESMRPDFFVIDDPQSDADARNPETVKKIEDNIQGGVLGSGEISERISAVMASTPIEHDDVSERFADEKLHPEWMAVTEPFVRRWGSETLRDEYLALLAADHAKGDQSLEASRKFYTANRAEIERGAEMLDDGDFDPATEVSAYQHALWLLHTMKHKRFFSEMQMETQRDESLISITPRLILSRVRAGHAKGTHPDGTILTVATADINPSYAITVTVTDFDQVRTATVIDHWRHRCKISSDLNDTEFHAEIYNHLAQVVEELRAKGYDVTAQNFALGFDCSGAQFKPVNRFVFDRRRDRTANAFALRGLDNKTFNPRISTRKFAAVPGRNDTVLTLDKATGWEHVNFNKDKYELAAQRAWLTATGAPGGLSLYEPVAGESHDEFALQVCGEVLMWKPADPERDRLPFKWNDRVYPRHDYGDCVYMAYALAGFIGLAADGAPMFNRAKSRRRAFIGGRVV